MTLTSTIKRGFAVLAAAFLTHAAATPAHGQGIIYENTGIRIPTPQPLPRLDPFVPRPPAYHNHIVDVPSGPSRPQEPGIQFDGERSRRIVRVRDGVQEVKVNGKFVRLAPESSANQSYPPNGTRLGQYASGIPVRPTPSIRNTAPPTNMNQQPFRLRQIPNVRRPR